MTTKFDLIENSKQLLRLLSSHLFDQFPLLSHSGGLKKCTQGSRGHVARGFKLPTLLLIYCDFPTTICSVKTSNNMA